MKISLSAATLSALLVSGALMQAGAVRAADTEGNFAVKGFGLRPCSDFLAARQEQAPAYLAYRSWLNGYATAYNQMTPRTYDIGGQTQLENWLTWIGRYCENNADTPYVLAATALTAALQDQRLESRPGGTARPDAKSAETVRAIQTALKERGLYKGAIDGDFGPGTRAALSQYQEREGLKVTGQPDVPTVTSLLGR